MLQTEDIDWLNAYKNNIRIYAVYKRPIQTQRHIQTESEGMEKDIPCKWKTKESWSSNSHIRKNRLKIKTMSRDKENHYIMNKVSIQEEDITM